MNRKERKKERKKEEEEEEEESKLTFDLFNKLEAGPSTKGETEPIAINDGNRRPFHVNLHLEEIDNLGTFRKWAKGFGFSGTHSDGHPLGRLIAVAVVASSINFIDGEGFERISDKGEIIEPPPIDGDQKSREKKA